jgi:transcriptional regulator with XRE-family HTH domain
MKQQHSTDTVLGRIRLLMYQKHLTQAEFAKEIGIDPSNVSKYLSERLPVSDALLNRIVVNFKVSKQWLRDGVGLPYDKSDHAVQVTEAERILSYGINNGIPVYDIDVAAGCVELAKAFTEENVIGRLNFPQLNPEWVVVRAKGDSMVPKIINGGYVAFLPISDVEHILWGQIYVVVLENRRVVKYVRRHESNEAKVVLRSANPEYDDMDVNKGDILGLYLVERIINIQDCF